MSRYTGPKCRLCRREGVSLCGKEKCALKKKNYIPGMHGPKGSFAKKSEYARQLREKQKLKRLFGITERQLSNYFEKAGKMKDITGDALLKLLEYRLDNVIYRSGIAKTRNQARQMVNHGLFKVNNIKINIPSLQMKAGDKFEAIARIKKSKLFAEVEKQKYAPAKWIKVDYKTLMGEVTRPIEKEELESIIQSNLIVEFYSKA
ncbi:MAG: 30S ribosomal protein S4 [Candidatus Gracilibacteria bacterium]|jgi:small subunit ribosomal protein S4